MITSPITTAERKPTHTLQTSPPLTNIDEAAKVGRPITIMATTHPASSPALSRLRTAWPSQTLMRRSCSSLSTDLLPRFVLAVLFEVPGYVLSCESFPCADGHCALCPHFFATLLPSQPIGVSISATREERIPTSQSGSLPRIELLRCPLEG